jgi:hypothetical protein
MDHTNSGIALFNKTIYANDIGVVREYLEKHRDEIDINEVVKVVLFKQMKYPECLFPYEWEGYHQFYWYKLVILLEFGVDPNFTIVDPIGGEIPLTLFRHLMRYHQYESLAILLKYKPTLESYDNAELKYMNEVGSI